MKYNIEWFKENLINRFSSYKMEYRYFSDGDFGDLEQAIFENPEKGGGIDFWSMDYIGIHLYDYKEDIELMNIMLALDEAKEKERALNELVSLIEIDFDQDIF